jgi:hypothetical protein
MDRISEKKTKVFAEVTEIQPEGHTDLLIP